MAPIRIGYVGVGLMGLPMVRRLVSRGHDVVAYDIIDRQVELATAAGARAASAASQVVRDAEFVLLNLPTTDAVEEAVFGSGGVATAITSPQLVIDFSTNEVARGRALASFAEKRPASRSSRSERNSERAPEALWLPTSS